MLLSKFCRIELMTADAEAAVAFYGRLFGWRAEAEALADGHAYYWLTGQDGASLGGLYAMPADLQRQGVASHWVPHIAARDADELGAVAHRLGARVTASAFPVLGRGLLALLQDPTGAPFGLWAATDALAAPAPEVSLPVWCELSTSDPAAAAQFYAELCGWEARRHDAGDAGFTTLHAGDAPVAALLAIGSEYRRIPSHWLVYVSVGDVQAASAAAVAAGARVLAPARLAAGLGMQAVVQDPQGAVFGLVEALPFR